MKQSESNVFLQQNQYPPKEKQYLTLFGAVMKYKACP